MDPDGLAAHHARGELLAEIAAGYLWDVLQVEPPDLPRRCVLVQRLDDLACPVGSGEVAHPLHHGAQRPRQPSLGVDVHRQELVAVPVLEVRRAEECDEREERQAGQQLEREPHGRFLIAGAGSP
jgi:hypothetical protein